MLERKLNTGIFGNQHGECLTFHYDDAMDYGHGAMYNAHDHVWRVRYQAEYWTQASEFDSVTQSGYILHDRRVWHESHENRIDCLQLCAFLVH